MGRIFVFGSNLAGIHGAGAAAYAMRYYNAVYGCGEGIQGNSYGIPTKDRRIQTLPLDKIQQHVTTFIEYAQANPDKEFNVTRIGCGLAGYTDTDIAPLFKGAPENCYLPEGWRALIAQQ